MNPSVRGIVLGLALYTAYLGLLALIVHVAYVICERRERRRAQLLREWHRVLTSGESPFTVYQNHYGSGELVEFPPGAISQADPGGVHLVRLIGPSAGEVMDGD